MSGGVIESLIHLGSVRLTKTSGTSTVEIALNVLNHSASGFSILKQASPDYSVLVVHVYATQARQIAHSWRVKSPTESSINYAVNDALVKLLPCLRNDEEGQGNLVVGGEMKDSRRLDELYKTLPSPKMLDSDGLSALSAADRLLVGHCQSEGPMGMKSDLYRYQKRSLSRMLQAELAPYRMQEPEYLEMREGNRGQARPYFLDTNRWLFRRTLDHYNLPRGGILCEQMGVGKTVICLALIVATRDHLACIPSSMDCAPAVTEYSLRTFPFPEQSRVRLALASSGSPVQVAVTRVPTLVQLAFHKLACSREAALDYPDVPPHVLAEASALDFRQHYFEFDKRTRARSQLKPPRKVFLSAATLVVVPNMLLLQWATEIKKHVLDGILNVLEVTGSKGRHPLPDVMTLLGYDVILISQERLSHERKDASVLMDIRWKRLIIDEGHIAQSRNTATVDFASHLSIERKWIVTGTPTRHLLGLDLESNQIIPSLADQHITAAALGVTVPSPSKKRKRPAPQEVVINRSPQRWYPEELEDLSRLGSLFCFLGVEPFASARARYASDIMKPLRNDHFGSVKRLRMLFRHLLIRHESQDIREEMPLPPLEIRSVGLDFDRLGRITHNVLISLIVGNLITSQATDADYLLHPRNLGDLHQAISNLHLSCMWFTSQNTGFAEAIEILERSLREKYYTPQEVYQLEKALHHLMIARDDQHWSHLMASTVSVIFDVTGLPEEVSSAYSECRVKSARDEHRCQAPGPILAADGLLRIRRSACTRSTVEGIVVDSLSFFRERRIGDDIKDSATDSAAAAGHLKGAGSNRPAGDSQIKQAVKSAATAVKTAMKELGGEEGPSTLTDSLDFSPLPHTIDVFARSSKVHWVMKEVLLHPDDKFLVFADPWVLGYLTEAMDLIQVKSVYVGPYVSLSEKQDALASFEMPSHRVCLLDLRLAARGLNLTAANRVIFIEPVWKPDVEAQAIKRVHRMGQTKPVFVTKLYIRGTFEEDMINRESVASDAREDQFQMSRLIEKPRFVETDDPPPFDPIKLVMGPERVVGSPSCVDVAHAPVLELPTRRRLVFALPE